MSYRNFDTLLSRIEPSVPGCPRPMVLEHINRAARRACERTLAWRYAQPMYTLTAGVADYTYTKPTDSEVHAVFRVLVNDSPLAVLTLEEAIDHFPDWVDVFGGVDPAALWTGSGSFDGTPFAAAEFNAPSSFTLSESALEGTSDPRYFTQVSPDRFVVLPAPDNVKPYAIRLFYALKPKTSSTSMPAVIVDDLEDTIVHNVLNELLVLPGVAWTDRELATYHARQYLAKSTERRARANLGTGRATLTARMRPFV